MNQTQMYFAGVDWASEKHDVWLTDAGGKRLGMRTFTHSGEGLAQLCAWLTATSGAEPGQIHVAIEVPHGPVVEALLERGFNVYAINPKQLDRFRDRFTLAGAKDDSRDAETLASSLRTDGRAFRKLAFDEPALVELREYSRLTDELTQEKNRLANRIRQQLWRYYPQIAQLDADLPEWVLDVWEAAPDPAKAARLSKRTASSILKKRRIRRIGADEVLGILRTQPLSVAPGVTDAAKAHIRLLAERLRLVNKQIKEAHGQLDRLGAVLAAPAPDSEGEAEPGQPPRQRDAAILDSLPGIARIGRATLLAEATEALRLRDYHALRILCGQAPVTRRSGKSRIVVRRYACNPRLANALYHWARVASQIDEKCKAKYAELRKRGHSHARALRSVGDRLLAVACAMLEKGTLFDPAFGSAKTAC
jgi:transposase